MPTHDIIDNRNEKLIDHLSQMLGSSERARFAVGHLFLSGLTSVAKRLLNLKELRNQSKSGSHMKMTVDGRGKPYDDVITLCKV